MAGSAAGAVGCCALGGAAPVASGAVPLSGQAMTNHTPTPVLALPVAGMWLLVNGLAAKYGIEPSDP